MKDLAYDDVRRFSPVSLQQFPGSNGKYCVVGNDWVVNFGDTAINFGCAECLARHVAATMSAGSAMYDALQSLLKLEESYRELMSPDFDGHSGSPMETWEHERDAAIEMAEKSLAQADGES